jgi:hypothetical protein
MPDAVWWPGAAVLKNWALGLIGKALIAIKIIAFQVPHGGGASLTQINPIAVVLS